jgi:hypothetical protein
MVAKYHQDNDDVCPMRIPFVFYPPGIRAYSFIPWFARVFTQRIISEGNQGTSSWES